MSEQRVVTVPEWLKEQVVRQSAVRDVLLVLAASILIAISAQIAIPIWPVPMTMQPVAILLVGAALGSTRGAVATLLYLLEGLGGLPVFANGAFGPAVFLGPTAGYLLAFPAGAWIAGKISERAWGRSVGLTIVGMMLAIATIHLGGWSWLAAVMGLGAKQALLVGVAPFWVSDVVKIAIAATLLPAAQHLVGSNRHS